MQSIASATRNIHRRKLADKTVQVLKELEKEQRMEEKIRSLIKNQVENPDSLTWFLVFETIVLGLTLLGFMAFCGII